MGFKVHIQNPCSCVAKNALMTEDEFKTEAEAKKHAEKTLDYMQNNFCNKHEFNLVKDLNAFRIIISLRQ